jgi:hypothetical protein
MGRGICGCRISERQGTLERTWKQESLYILVVWLEASDVLQCLESLEENAVDETIVVYFEQSSVRSTEDEIICRIAMLSKTR